MIIYSGKCYNNAGTRNGHAVVINHSLMKENETTHTYKWVEAFDQENIHVRYPPMYRAQEYAEYEKVNSNPDQYRFLVKSTMKGNGCRPTLMIQLFPGPGTLGPNMFYDFSEPLPIPTEPTDAEELEGKPKGR